MTTGGRQEVSPKGSYRPEFASVKTGKMGPHGGAWDRPVTFFVCLDEQSSDLRQTEERTAGTAGTCRLQGQ